LLLTELFHENRREPLSFPVSLRTVV